jgi:hypothetical protein
MPPDEKPEPTQPNPSRITDYFLGGHHNFEVDRQAGERILKLTPWTKQLSRLQRKCLQGLAVELTHQRGFDVVIDFASGLPTAEPLHTFVRPGTTVIYSDKDPEVVTYAREILGATPNVHYLQADATRPEELLNSQAVREILGDRRDVAFIYWAVSAWLLDEELAHAAAVLYEWSGPKACWAFNAQAADMNLNDPRVREVIQIFEKMGRHIYVRALKYLDHLLHPWYPDAFGFISLLDWHSLPRDYLTEADRMSLGISGGGYGAYLIK